MMEQKELRAWEARCIQEEPPACKAGCPLGVDGRAFALAVARGDMKAARSVLDRSMPLTGITARICEAPCEQYCIRHDLGGSISLAGLERACVEAEQAKGKMLKLPPRPKKAVLLGGGPSSLTVAFDLAKKGYPITLYHSGTSPGGSLRELPEKTLPLKVVEEEWERLERLGVSLKPLAELNNGDTERADAVFIGYDDELEGRFTELRSSIDPITFTLETEGWFGGGTSPENHAYRFITDISQGRQAAVSMDRHLQGASLTAGRIPLRHGKTGLYTNTADVEPVEKILPDGENGFTREEAVQEAGRCLDCQCLECVKHCEFLKEYDGFPKTYARRIYNNSAIVKGTHLANTMINSCSLCRQCEELCPNDFSMADLCLQARQTMVIENRMPPSAHWFALEEMYSAQSEGALLRHAPGMERSVALFFPGCQLAGIRPEQTLRLYDTLLELEPATGIRLDCCGVPAHWAGREEEFTGFVETLKKAWLDMGSPKVITACSTCLFVLRTHLPEIESVSAWSILVDDIRADACNKRQVAVSDPCTARHDTQTREDVRRIIQSLGCTCAPLPMSGELTECCGFGGLMENANPRIAGKTVRARAAQTEEEILTYCAMCRDRLAKAGSPVSHILDLMFRDLAHPADEAPCSISDRRINRRKLKNELLSRYPREELPDVQPWEDLTLEIPEDVAALLEQRRILRDDIRRVLYATTKNGTRFIHGDNRTTIASAKLGAVTFWVRFREEMETYHIESCWSHRMLIKGGAE